MKTSTFLLIIVLGIGALIIFKLAIDAISWQVCSQTRMDHPAFKQMQCAEVVKKHYGLNNISPAPSYDGEPSPIYPYRTLPDTGGSR